MQIRTLWVVLAAVVASGCWMVEAKASIFFFDASTSYLSTANIPAGFYDAAGPIKLEDFEDGIVDPAFVPDAGQRTKTSGFPSIIDSVDADDGTIDGSGLAGDSWFRLEGSFGVKFVFNTAVLPTAAGIVWTDGGTNTTV